MISSLPSLRTSASSISASLSAGFEFLLKRPQSSCKVVCTARHSSLNQELKGTGENLSTSQLLYSTNTFLKLYIQQEYRSDIHYVWCSEYFDSTKSPAYSPGSLIPPSSDPKAIYDELRRDVDRGDGHSYKINEQKVSIKKRAIDWEIAGEITAEQKDEIIFMVDNSKFSNWRPLLYLIPRQPVEARLELVTMSRRAGFGKEYIIRDLKRSEFDILEF